MDNIKTDLFAITYSQLLEYVCECTLLENRFIKALGERAQRRAKTRHPYVISRRA